MKPESIATTILALTSEEDDDTSLAEVFCTREFTMADLRAALTSLEALPAGLSLDGDQRALAIAMCDAALEQADAEKDDEARKLFAALRARFALPVTRYCLNCNKPLTTEGCPSCGKVAILPPGNEQAAAMAGFDEWFAKNYPGPDTIIFDPKWHAPRIYRAAMWHQRHAARCSSSVTESEREELQRLRNIVALSGEPVPYVQTYMTAGVSEPPSEEEIERLADVACQTFAENPDEDRWPAVVRAVLNGRGK